jgi:CBS domain containing-hemolysin-like protein
MASLGLGWIAEPTIAALIDPVFSQFPGELARLAGPTVAIVIAFTVVTSLHIVVGEQAPKMLAIQRAEAVILVIAAPIELFRVILGPAIWLLNGASDVILRLVGLHLTTDEDRVHSVEELRYLVSASRDAGVLNEAEGKIVDRVFGFSETRAHDVLIPRTAMVAVDVNASLDAAMGAMDQKHHTRLPVYDEQPDNVVGILHLYDLVHALRNGIDPTTAVRGFVREALIVPEGASIEVILNKMREARTKMAIVIDEHGGTAGLVTLEDLVEEIVGQVQDEFETASEPIHYESDGTMLVDGRLDVGEVAKRFDLRFIEDKEYDTVSGLVMAKLDRIPKVGDQFPLGDYVIRVESMDRRRVKAVRLSKQSS